MKIMWGLLEYPFLGLSRLLEVCHNTESNGFDSLSPMKMARFPERQCREGWLGFENVYCNLGPPLTPCGEDRQFVEHALSMWVASHPAERLQALLLGVTPLLARISWPPKSFLAAIDLSRAMVESVWPGDLPGLRAAIQADWLALPLRDSSLDMALGDGSPIALRYPEGYRSLARGLRAVLKPDGVFILRAFVRPAVSEDPRDVVADLARNVTFHQFKLRLAMALQASPETGCRLDRVHSYWADCKIDRAALVFQTHWRREEIDTIDRYRDLDDVYTFPTLAELRSVLGEFFRESSVFVPSYPLGERCPTLVLRP